MHLRALAFLLGVLALHGLGVIPGPGWTILLVLLPWIHRHAFAGAMIAPFLGGFLWALLHAHVFLGPGLPVSMAGKEVRVIGVVEGLPEAIARGVRFGFRLESGMDQELAPVLPRRVRVSWYGPAPVLEPGDRWELSLRLRPRNGMRNPGGFDYERWLFQQRFGGIAHVRDGDSARYLGREHRLGHVIDRQRLHLVHALKRTLPDGEHEGVLRALAVGDRSGLNQVQWKLLIDTGTNHLMAISGLHIGLTAGMGYAGMLWLWRLIPGLALRLPAQRAAVPVAMLCAVGYAALAGFAVPTQRALVMLLVVMGALWFRRTARPARTLALAMLAVLLIDPQAPLTYGFWLSFAAVAVILYAFSGRIGRPGRLTSLMHIQWVTSLGLVPLTFVMFQHASLISPLANLLAVPWVSFVVVPLTLAGALILPVWPWLAEMLWQLAHLCVGLLWPVLEIMAALPHAYWRQTSPFWTLAPALLGLVWLMAPRGWPARWLGLFLLLPMLWPPRMTMSHGEFRLSLLDVGQGLASVVETAGHTLVFDTGPRLGPRLDAGEAAVMPYLRYRGRIHVDTLIVSHGDLDHAGGTDAILAQARVARILGRDPLRHLHSDSRECLQGQHWEWDGVRFEMLHPPPHWGNDNASSCVLRVSGPGGALLLTGDVENIGRTVLIHGVGAGLRADVLILPHHGARGSVTPALLDHVQPRLALVTAGFNNAHGHPHPEVLAELRARQVPVLNTADLGMIRVAFLPGQGVRVERGYRQQSQRHWSRQASGQGAVGFIPRAWSMMAAGRLKSQEAP